jgi:O-antigen ligase
MSEYWQWRIFLQFFLGSALLVCVIGVYQYVFVPNVHMHEWVDAKQFPKLMRRMSSTLQNPNLLGAYLLMVLSVAGSYVLTYFKAKRYEEVYKILPVAIVVFLVMLLTYSRGIWVSFAAMVLYWGIVVERRLLWSLLGIPIVLYFYQGEIAGRLWSLFHGQDTSVALRWALWDSTTYIIAEHPIFGIGWNTFWLVYPDYNYFIQAPVILMYHAHNLYLNMLAEIGIPGFILFMTVIIGHAVAALRLDGDGFRKSAQIGVGTLVVAILVSGLSDFELYSHQVAVVFWQLLGWVGAFMKVNEKSHK